MTDSSAETNLVEASESELFSDLKPPASRRHALAEFPPSVRFDEVARLVATAAPVAKPRVPPPPDLGLFSVEPSDPESGVSRAAPLVGAPVVALDATAEQAARLAVEVDEEYVLEAADWDAELAATETQAETADGKAEAAEAEATEAEPQPAQAQAEAQESTQEQTETDPVDVQAVSALTQLESISRQFDTEWDDWQLTEQQLELPEAIRALPPPPVLARSEPELPPVPALPALPPVPFMPPTQALTALTALTALRAAPTVPPGPPVPGFRSVLPPIPKPPDSLPAASLQPLPPLAQPPSTTLRPPRSAMLTMPAMRAVHQPKAAASDALLTPLSVGRAHPLFALRRIARRTNARVALAMGTVFGLIVLLVVVGIVSSVGRGSGSLVVTVSGPGSSAVSGIEVLVDGESKCVSSPCRVEPLPAGTHLVKVRGRGFQATTSLAVAVNAGAASALHIPLSRPVDNRPAPDALAVTEPKPLTPQTARGAEVPVMQLESEPALAMTQKFGKLAVTEPARAAPIESKPAEAKLVAEAAAPKGFGMLRISSLPAVTVAVDGRPVGTTPKVVRVAAGSHRVAFFGKEGRRTQTVNVAAGASQAVTAKF